MKIKNLVAFAMLALGVVAAPFAAKAGDIISIVPVSGSCEPSDALKSGQKFQFMVRLAARDYEAEQPGEWASVYVGVGSEALDAVYNPPKVGIVVSGRMRYADIVSSGPNPEKGALYTDLYCEYRVQPGDFALPVKLALAGSTEESPLVPLIDAEDASAGYFIKNVAGVDPLSPKWIFRSIDVDGGKAETNTCDFTWCANTTKSDLYPNRWPSRDPAPVTDIDLSKASFYVKSIDFDSDNPDYPLLTDYWRTVHETTIETVPSPTIETIGISSTNSAPVESTKFYVWCEDEGVAYMDGANVKERTLHLPPDGTATGKRHVYEFDLVTGVSKYPIVFRGVERGRSTTIVLSATPDYTYNFGKTAQVTNYLYRPIFVDEPPKPNIKVTWDSLGTQTLYPETVVAFTNDLSEVAEQGIPLYITLSEPFGEETTLHLKAKIADDASGDWNFVYTNALIGTLAKERSSFTVPPVETNITFAASEKQLTFWVYPVGGIPKTKNPGVTFSVDFDVNTPAAIKEKFENNGSGTLRFYDPRPAIVTPTASDSYAFSGGSCTIPVVVMDSYRDLSEPRTFTVQAIANGIVLCVSNAVPFRSGESTAMVLDGAVLQKLQGPEAKEVKLQIKVTDPLNQTATSEAVTLSVPAKEKTPTVAATLYDSTEEGSEHAGSDFREGDSPIVRFTLDPEPLEVGDDLYAFLVPRNWASSNLVKYAALETGTLISGGQLQSKLTFNSQLALLDGTSETDGSVGQLEFDIVMKKKTASGAFVTDTTYTPAESPALVLTVQNVPSTYENAALYVNGSPEPTPNGATNALEVASGVDQSFVASYNDASSIDLASGIVTVWCFTDGKNSNTYKYSVVTSATDSAECKHAFTTVDADQKVMWIPVDKDTLKTLTAGVPLTDAALKTLWPSLVKITPAYTIMVHVGDAPHIVLDAEEIGFAENSRDARVRVMLSETYDDANIYLRLKLTSLNDYSDNPGHVTFPGDKSSYVVEIKQGTLEPTKNLEYNKGLKFDYENLDGTMTSAEDGFYLEAEAFADADCLIPLTRFVKAESYVYVTNCPPTIKPPESANVTTNKSLAVNEDFTLTWSVNDVKRDLTDEKGLVCRWYIDDNVQNDKTVVAHDTSDHTTTLRLTSDGFHEVRLEVEDKEGEDVDGKATRRWFYYITPTKTIEVKAVGPSSVSKTKYVTAAGLGEGRVWANGIKGTAENFAQTWTYSIKALEAEVHAYGYASAAEPYYDDGTLGGIGRDLAIDPDGNSFLGTPVREDCYRIDGLIDNFFYCWAVMVPNENGGIAAVEYSTPQPQQKPTLDVSEAITLDAYEEEKDSYAKRRVEAVFSREFLWSDNLGDINADGIPDLYLTKVWKNAFGDVFDPGTGQLTGNDLARMNGFNDDADYLPATPTAADASLIPELAETWVALGHPFTALMEIRGQHEGLNDAPEQTGIRNVKPDRVYEMADGTYNPTNCTISELEYLAWKDTGLTDVTKWSPERPTDPTTDDTDEDGMPDGYEYYFWYRAHVGYMEGTNHLYQIGHRYNPADPAHPTIITPDEIKQVMDPLAPYAFSDETDTDNDGVPDLLEFEIGTNPFEFDTDGDGLPDGYEVLIGTKPLVNLRYSDSVSNPDGDAMAFEKASSDWKVYALGAGDGRVVYRAIRTSALNGIGGHPGVVQVVDGPSRTDGWKFKTADGTVYYTTKEPKYRTDPDGAIRLSGDLLAKETWLIENDYLGLPAYVQRGRTLDGAPEAGAEAKTKQFEFTLGATVTNGVPANCDLSVRPYSAFQYGMSGDIAGDDKIWGGFAVCGDAEVKGEWPILADPEVEKAGVYIIHYISYQERGFDPRTGWKDKNEKTRAFATYDEFLALPFHFHMNARGDEGGLHEIDLVPTQARPWKTIWSEFTTDPFNADTDADGMPDGWELYVMSGPSSTFPDGLTPGRTVVHPRSPLSPLLDYGLAPQNLGDADGLNFRQEFDAVDSCANYPDCETIENGRPEWRNKKWPTDPWTADTDGDGLGDGAEGDNFIYGDPEDDGMAGGGLNPCTWDTDGDGLPDPWEAEFAGHLVEGEATTKTETIVDEATGSTNTVTTVLRAAGSWEGGMDGTVGDASLDYDFDGLQNWQEYMAGTIRCWRYDDTVTPWGRMPEIRTAPPSPEDEEAWGEYWFNLLINEQSDAYNPHYITSMCDNGAPYMSLCTNKWDSAAGKWYYFRDGVYHDLANPPARYTVPGDPPVTYNRFTKKVMDTWNAGEPPFYLGTDEDMAIYPAKYICCSPSLADTDGDGLDDFYEMFHGMNPLLGADAVRGDAGIPKDIIYEAYYEMTGRATTWSAKNNYWNNAREPHAKQEDRFWDLPAPNPFMDFVACPWLNGLGDADPDGDDIRNQLEGIMPNLQAASTFLHSDPTPLWMTDRTYSDSLVNLYFVSEDAIRGSGEQAPLATGPDGFWYDTDNDGKPEYHKFADFGFWTWDGKTREIKPEPYNYNYYDVAGGYFYSFEENEGFDTDHDFLGDLEESQGKTKSASDPLDADNPRRRQAMYFDGAQSFLSHPLAVDELLPDKKAGAEVRQNYLYYTVECWAKPEDPSRAAPQALVERTVLASEANPGDQRFVRKNFHIGIRNGRWYTKFDASGTGERNYVEITEGPLASNRWTHVAASYDGQALRLYVDGVCVKTKETHLQPEHSVTMLIVESLDEETAGEGLAGKVIPALGGYEPVAFTIGASPVNEYGIVVDYQWRISPFAPMTTFDDFTDYFKGYIDEVRIWDGARPGEEILSDVRNRVRYDREIAMANRDKVFAAWRRGATRLGPTDTTRNMSEELPAELMHHWTFDHLPGAVKTSQMMVAPNGFATREEVVDSRANWCRPKDWTNPWWDYSGVPYIHSQVYTDYAVVPWIADTVAHLPRFDQTTLDSVYWSENYAGEVEATSRAFTRFAFPRSCEPISKWSQLGYGTGKTIRSCPTRYDIVADDDALLDALRFTLRNRHTEGDDLLPFGNAFPKRISETEGGMWDEQGPADAWAQTGKDGDYNNLPDWWQAYARANYSPSLDPGADLGWDTTVVFNGVEMPAWQAYLRDLARGMLPDGKIHPEFADRLDLDGDKLPDWWENLYSVQGNKPTDGMEDPDHDGLSNYQEWLCSEGEAFGYGIANGYPLIDPKLAHSHLGQEETDYFLTMTNGAYAGLYLGEIFADHDMMEDDLESDLGTDRTLYDAWSDADEDGWTAWSELRYSTYKMSRVSRLVSHMVGEEEVVDSPIPVVHANLRYNSEKAAQVATVPVVVQAYSGANLQRPPVATWIVRPGEAVADKTLYLGAWSEGAYHGTLTPGHVLAGFEKISLQCAYVQQNEKYSWTKGETNFSGTYAEMLAAYSADPENVIVNNIAFSWADLLNPVGESKALQLSVNEQTQKGYFLFDNERIGEIDFLTGDFTLSLAQLKGYFMKEDNIDLTHYFYRLSYSVQVPTLQTRNLAVSLATPDEGLLKEGTASFTAFIDLNGNGAYDPDEPIGFAKDVEIGWDRVVSLAIEMADKSAAAGERFAYGDDVESLRIIRTAFNGEMPVKRRIVYSRNAADSARKTVFEGDLVTAGKFGLDWSGLRADILAEGLAPRDVTEVTYLVVKNALSVDHINEEDILRTITVDFPAQQTKPTAVSPSPSSMPIVESQRPTFTWGGTDDNTAFALRILDASRREIWSNTNTLAVLPPRNASGNYVWTAPVFIGRDTCDDVWSLENGTNYFWQVALFNAKFSKIEDAVWSDPAQFSTALAADNDFTTSYGTAKVAVRYFGPATNDLSSVVVRLYRTADFTGVPAAQTRLFETNGNVRALADGTYEVKFLGLETGDYYACAFIDRNGNMTRDRWETWGYANQIGLNLQAIYTPTALSVDAAYAKVPSATVYMEDTDVNQDGILDCLTEDESILSAASAASAGDDGSTDIDGDGLTADEEASDTYTDKAKWDTDGDLMPDGWEARFADLDPLFSDANVVAAGDVMAFATEPGRVVSDAAGVSYLLMAPSNVTYRTGDVVTNAHLCTYYDYSTVLGEGTNTITVTYCGIGTNLVGDAATFRIAGQRDVTVAYVHAQVYDRFGYSLKTAIPQDGAINTKPFTALDKYMVVRYLAAMGLADEEKMNKEKTWPSYTLKPLDNDNDRDGMLDGWELYVMFGTNGCGFVTDEAGEIVHATDLSQVVISPWKFGDRALDLDGDGLSNVDENCDGNDPSDPWNPYSVYESLVAEGVIPPDTEKFDDKVRRFGIGESELDTDWDIDLISNGQEMWSYYLDYANKSTLLADIDPKNAWSDGTTPDYFRTFAEKPDVTNYLGAVWNGAEFIEPRMRVELSIIDEPMSGTRDYNKSGWDYWSTARFLLTGNYDALSYTNVVGWVVPPTKVEDPSEAFKWAPDELKNLHRTGAIEIRTCEFVMMTNTVEEGAAQILPAARFGYKDLIAMSALLPDPMVKIALKYAGNDTLPVTIEAYQVSSAYPEYGEQLTAKWTSDAAFDAGLSKITLSQLNRTVGTLKQGKTRFVAYIDVDGDGKLSAADTFGTAEAHVGFLGCDLTIRLGEANAALPVVTLSAADSNGTERVVQTVAIVRTKVNGAYLSKPRGVTLRRYENNVNRTVLYPADYVSEDYIGLDKYLASEESELDPSAEALPAVETVTYEIVKLARTQAPEGEDGYVISNTNLNHYVWVEDILDEDGDVVSNVAHTVDQALNEEFTVRYSIERDVALDVRGRADSTEGDAILSFTIPTDRAVTKFWLNIDGACYGVNNRGFLLPNVADGRVILDTAWFKENGLAAKLTAGIKNVKVALGNDKFPEAPVAADEWSAVATFSVAQGASYDGRIAVKVTHPTAALDAQLTVAAYEKADLANPVAVTNGCAAGETVELVGLLPGKDYYVAAWYVKNAADGRDSKNERLPYDTWGYVTSLGKVENGFDAAEVKAASSPAVTNLVFLQDTDWNANGIIDRDEDIRGVIGKTPSVAPEWDPLDVDCDYIPDPEDPDPVIDNSGDWLEGDVMAYQVKKMLCVQIGTVDIETNWVWYAVTDLAKETTADKLDGDTIVIPRGTLASDLKSIFTTYLYGRKKNSPFGLGQAVTLTEGQVYHYEWKDIALVHHQVYAENGFNPNTANALIPESDWVNTKKFTRLDKYIVTNYLAAVGALPPGDPMTDWTLRESNKKTKYNIDHDRDGIPDGWELYTMFGTNAVQVLTKAAKDDVINAWVADDRNNDPDEDGCTNLHEYNGGQEPTDPWNAYSMYENLAKAGLLLPGTPMFTDNDAKRFGLTAETIDEDDDLDLISNIDELKAYYRDPAALADLAVTNAWSDGSTPDYFRACGSKYLGELFNGAEFIEPAIRRVMSITTFVRSGTRDYRASGWDAWSTARYSIKNAEQTINIDGVVSDELMLLIRYWNVIRPGEFTGTTVGEAVDFFHTTWEGVKRILDAAGNVVVEGKGSISGPGVKLVEADAAQTTTQIVAFFGGQKKMEETIARNKKDITADEIVTPEPMINLVLKYAGNESYDLILEAYQTSSAYPEYGEQLTAQWTTPVKFDSGVAKINEIRTPALGSLKQGPARFVAYIDVDGDGKLSAADTFGMAETAVGYLGADVTIRLGDANPALPVLRTADASNTTWSTIAIVRSAINGKPLYNQAQGVNYCLYENNVAREALFPSEYISGSFVGIDSKLAGDYGREELANIESVTYEVLRLSQAALADVAITNLNHYMVITNGTGKTLVTNVFDSAVNEEFTIHYSNTRDKADEFTWAGSTADDCSFSFSVPNDGFANTRFWLKVNGSEFGGTAGFPLTGLAGKRMVLDSEWLVKNGVAAKLNVGAENSFAVMLGNDKFGKDSAAWQTAVKFFVGVKPEFDGKLLVEVRHPTNAELDAKLTVAAYEKADLANPVVTVTGQALGDVVELSGLRVNQAYYIAAWYVKNADDGRDSASARMPYDTWGYLTMLGETANGFEAKAVKAVDPENRMIDVPMVTNLVFLQDTDWNDNNVIDREEAIISTSSKIVGSAIAGGPFKIRDAEKPNPGKDDTVIDNDVMAYAVVTYPCVTVTDGADEYIFAVTDLANEFTTNRLTKGIPVGTPLRELRTLKTTYMYDFGEADAEILGLGTNVQFGADCDWKVIRFEERELVLVHAQVYDTFGFNPNTANGSVPSANWVNTKTFTPEDRAFVTNYLANVCGVAEAWKYAIPDGSNDSDMDGIINGWELYVMYGPKGAGKGEMTHNPLNPDDRHFDADGDGLDQLHEYDGGYLPTDPWNADTDRDNVTDFYAWMYHLKSQEDAADDWDGDGLSNYAEYLSSEVFGLLPLDQPDKAHTSDGIHDYFRKAGELYLGEIFTDHDHMTDAVEDLFSEMNRYVYDAHEDGDGDGWSNWAEVCASIKAGFEPVETAVTNGDTVVTTKAQRPLYDGHPQPELRVKLRYCGVQDIVGATVVIKAYTQAEAFQPDAVFVTSNAIANASYNEVIVKVPDSGYLREGANTVFVYLAGMNAEGNTKEGGNDYVAGAPFAVMRDVDVGWSTVNLDVQLTDTDPSFARLPFAYADGNSDREMIWGGSTTTAGTNKQGQTIMHYGSSDVEINPDYTGDISALLDAKLTRIRVKRARVDGQKATQGSLTHRVIYDKYVPTDLRSFICEYDVIGAGEFDIDWANFRREVMNDEMVDIYGLPVTQVVYRICIGEGAFDINGTTNVYDEPWIEVSRRFEAIRSTPVATADSGVFYSARPTLTWTMGDGGNPRAGDTYSAFRVVITPAEGGSIDSGLMLRPVRDAAGRYSWTGPVLPPGDYTWKVSMYNAKFQTDAFSNSGKFSMATDLQQEMNDHGYGSIGVAVKYAGPANVLASGKVHVEAYDTPDFSGAPLSETILPANTASLAALASPTANCTVAGLRMGGTYYFRAYIDTNGNGRRDIWESWGYVKADNCDSVAKGIVLGGIASPVAGLFIEDCDTDQDWLPDAWEMVRNGSLGAQGAMVDPEGKIVFKGNTYEGLAGISTGLPGASLTVFNNLAVAKEMLGLPGEITIDAIRAAVEKKIVKSSVKITALTFDQANGKVILSVDAQVAESVAGAILSKFYTVTSPDTVTVKVKVYKIESLAEAWPAEPTVTKTVSFGSEEQEVEVELGAGDFTSGFFKIEVEE